MLVHKCEKEGVSIHIPMRLKKRGGRKLIFTPPGKEPVLQTESVPMNAMLTALVKAYEWQHGLEKGKFASLMEIADKEAATHSYVSRVYRLNFLAPDIKQAILDGIVPKALQLVDLYRPFPDLWEEQRVWFGFKDIHL